MILTTVISHYFSGNYFSFLGHLPQPTLPFSSADATTGAATAKNALENGNGVAWANDNTEVIAFAKQNTGTLPKCAVNVSNEHFRS